MTTITVGKYYIKVEGHSGYAEKGKDIVCAAISTLVEATYNYLLATRNEVSKKDDDGLFIIDSKVVNQSGKQIYDAFISMIEDLKEQYPKYIKIEEKR